MKPTSSDINSLKRRPRGAGRRPMAASASDLPGCNERIAPTTRRRRSPAGAQASTRASAHFSATHVLALRAGCWLVPDDLPAALYAPAKPATVLRTMLRARALAAHEASAKLPTTCSRRRGRMESCSPDGQLGAALVAELERRRISPRLSTPSSIRPMSAGSLCGCVRKTITMPSRPMRWLRS